MADGGAWLPVIEEVVLSLNALSGLTSAQQESLRRLGINRLTDLLHFQPIHDAQLIVALSLGRIVHDFEISPLVDAEHRGKSAADLLKLPVEALSGVGEVTGRELRAHFAVQTVDDLAKFEPFVRAEQLAAERARAFSEPPSAPPELMPEMIGSIANTINYSSFVNEKTLRLDGVELLYDEDRVHFIDPRLAALFPVRGLGPIFFGPRRAKTARGPLDRFDFGLGRPSFPRVPTPEPELHLGYSARFRQNWVNMGTSLGEVQHSLALAPGESRNVATIDWKRRHLTRREEDTTVKELLNNELVHTRALDEVARSTALEHQFGGTGIAAGTASASAATVLGAALAGGIAGSVPLAAIGALAGGLLAEGAPPVSNAIGAAAGAAGGAVIGFGLGAAIAGGTALLASGNAQLGVVRSDSTGDREIVAELAQDITETTSQKASSIRSLWSTVFVSDTQAENEQLQTRNVTNYNHSHALTIQYFEVLQHYRTEVEIAAAEALLFLPFRPLEFTIDLIADYWAILRNGVADVALRGHYDKVLGQFDGSAGRFRGGDEDDLVEIVVGVERAFIGLGGLGLFSEGSQLEVQILGISPAATKRGNLTRFRFSDEDRQASQVRGVQVKNLLPNESIQIAVLAKLEKDTAELFVSRSSDRRTADDQGTVRFDFTISGAGSPIEELESSADEIERFFNARRYGFTRRLLLSLEREQLIDLVEALVFRRAFEVNITPPNLRPMPGVPTALPGFSGRRPSLGAALGEAARNRVRQVILAEVADQPGIPPESLARIDASIRQMGDRLRQEGDLPARSRNAALNRAVQPLKSTLKSEASSVQAAVSAKVLTLLKDLATRLAGNVSLFEEAVPLTEFVDPNPFAITGNTLVFRMRTPSSAVAKRKLVVETPLKEAAEFVGVLGKFLKAELKKRNAKVRDVFLPTSGVFAEALLGRANASEKVDLTRFFNWQDSPIPHLAPAIAQLTAGSRAQEPLEVAPTVPANVLNVVTPAAFPDPTGMAGILAAIQNANIFRDMSKADVLGGVLANLAGLANQQGQLAGTLAGDARREALQSAVSFGSKIADLTAQALQAQPQPSAPQTSTEKGGALNEISKLIKEQQPPPADGTPVPAPPPIAGDPRARVVGVPSPAPDDSRSYQMSIQFLDTDGIPYSTGDFDFTLTMSFFEFGTFDINGGATIPLSPEGFFFPETFALTKGRKGQIRIDAHIGSTVVPGIREFLLPDSPDIVFKCRMKSETQKISQTDVKSAVDEVMNNSSFGGALNPIFSRFLNAGVEFPFRIFKISADGGSKTELNLRLEYNRATSTTTTTTTGSTTVTEFEVTIPKNGWDIEVV